MSTKVAWGKTKPQLEAFAAALMQQKKGEKKQAIITAAFSGAQDDFYDGHAAAQLSIPHKHKYERRELPLEWKLDTNKQDGKTEENLKAFLFEAFKACSGPLINRGPLVIYLLRTVLSDTLGPTTKEYPGLLKSLGISDSDLPSKRKVKKAGKQVYKKLFLRALFGDNRADDFVESVEKLSKAKVPPKVRKLIFKHLVLVENSDKLFLKPEDKGAASLFWKSAGTIDLMQESSEDRFRHADQLHQTMIEDLRENFNVLVEEDDEKVPDSLSFEETLDLHAKGLVQNKKFREQLKVFLKMFLGEDESDDDGEEGDTNSDEVEANAVSDAGSDGEEADFSSDEEAAGGNVISDEEESDDSFDDEESDDSSDEESPKELYLRLLKKWLNDKSLPRPETPEEKARAGLYWNLDDFQVVRVVGTGGYAVALLGYPKANPHYLVILRVELLYPEQFENLGWSNSMKARCQAYDYVKTFGRAHLNHVSVQSASVAEEHGWFFEESSDGRGSAITCAVTILEQGLGTLGSYLEKRTNDDGEFMCHNRESIKEVALYASQALSGVADIHRKGLLHRDLKPGNIVLVPDDSEWGKEAKLIDMGHCRELKTDESGETDETDEKGEKKGNSSQKMTQVYTPFYAHPKLLAQPDDSGKIKYGREADMYPMAKTIFEMLSGDRDFDEDHPGKKFFKEKLKKTVPAELGLKSWADLLHKMTKQKHHTAKQAKKQVDEIRKGL